MKWVHISDIHYDPDGDGRGTQQLREKLSDYLSGLECVDEMFITGDFRFAKTQLDTDKNADASVKWIRELSSRILKVDDPRHIHIVPGNHDLERFEHTTDVAETKKRMAKAKRTLTAIRKSYSTKDGQFSTDHKGYLLDRFSFFKRICGFLYDDGSVWAGTPCPLHTYQYLDEHNLFLLYINTAVACGGDDDYGKLIIGNNDLFRALRAIKNENKPGAPIIALAHHGLDCFSTSERKEIEKLLNDYNVKLYLCGDAHDGWNRPLTKETIELTMGCLKVANDTQAVFSVGEIQPDGFINVKTHQWDSAMDGWGIYPQFDDRIRQALPSPPPLPRESETKVFGRDAIVGDVSAALRINSVVTVHGPPGIGKSTICRKVLSNLAPGTFSEVQLTQQETLDLALIAIVGAFGQKPSDSEPLAQQVQHLCRNYSGHTLYLDNLEDPMRDTHFQSWFYTFVGTSGLQILCSSRTLVNAGRFIKNIPAPKLGLEDAVRMFIDRWGDDFPRADLPKLETLLEDLDRHPLSIHLVAGQKWRLPTVDDLSQAWHESETRPDIKFDNSDDRHHSLSAALHMSYAAIKKDDREAKILWGILSYVPGALSRELFGVIFADDLPIYRRAAETLLKNSLVEWTTDTPPSYAMLAPIKNMVFQFDDTIQPVCVEMLCDSLINVFSAAEQRDHADYLGRHHLALSCLPSALAFLRSTKLTGRSKCLAEKMTYYFQYSAFASLGVLCELEKHADDSASKAFLFRNMGDLELLLGETAAARKYYLEAEPLYRDERDNIGLANVIKSIGDFERRFGKIDAARKHYLEAESLYRDEWDNLGLANVIKSMGDLEYRLGNIDAVLKHYMESEQIYRDEWANIGLANVLNSMGELEREHGKIDAARKHYMESEQLYRDVRNNLGLANVLKSMGTLEHDYGKIDAAINHYLSALELYKLVREPIGRAYSLAGLCHAYAKQNKPAEAMKYINSATDALDTVSAYVAGHIKTYINEAKKILGIDP